MSRADGERLLAALQSGELARVASDVTTLPELARAFGMTRAAYSNTVHRLKSAGHAFPSWWSLIGSGGTDADDFADEDPTLTGVPSMPEPVRPPHVSGAPEGYSVRGESILYDADGEIRAKWVKTKKDQDDVYRSLLEAMTTIADQWTGLAEPVDAPEHSDDDLMTAFVIGDAHIGMFSWAPESGNDFDLKIAERDLYGAVDHLVDLAPAAKHALVVNVGDFYHADNRASTTTGGTAVDSDGRWPKVMSVGIRLMRRIIDRALEKYEHVTVINEVGNHDWHGSIMLSICLAQYYEREPRVTIDTSPAKFHWYRFGKNLIGVTHGDTVKLDALGEVMACDRPADWGETEHRYWLTGHIHHDTVRELRGCTVESFRTLAPGDAWHRGQGYRSGRDMKALVFHREHGQINRHTVGVNQIHSQLRKAAT